MRCLYFMIIVIFLSQGCGSIQKMRYSHGFNFHTEGWGKKEEGKRNSHGGKVKHGYSTLRKTGYINEDTATGISTTALLPLRQVTSDFKSKATFHQKEAVVSKEKIEPVITTKKSEVNKAGSFYIKKEALLGLMFAILAAIALYIMFMMFHLDTIFLVLILFASVIFSIVALSFCYRAIAAINEGDGNGKIFARLGILVASVCTFISAFMLRFVF